MVANVCSSNIKMSESHVFLSQALFTTQINSVILSLCWPCSESELKSQQYGLTTGQHRKAHTTNAKALRSTLETVVAVDP